MNAILYGDGIHDDTAAIQELIDSGLCEVSRTAKMLSDFKASGHSLQF